MPEYPYANVISNLRKFMEGIPNRGVPDKIDAEYLKQYGFASTNDIAIISILTFIGFANEQGKPTEDYIDFRISTKQEETMTRCLKIAYSDLFKKYPNAQDSTKQELVDFFKSKTMAGQLVLSRMESTFLLLCEFSSIKPAKKKALTKKPTPKKIAKQAPITMKSKPPVEKRAVETKKQPQVVVNIQLVLPESKDLSLYDELFKSIKKHLLE